MTSHNCSFLHVADFRHYHFHFLLSLHLRFFCNLLSCTKFLFVFHLLFHHKFLLLSFPMFHQRRRYLYRWRHSDYPSLTVRQLGQKVPYTASWLLSLQLRKGPHPYRPGQNPSFPSQDICERHWKELPESMRKSCYNYSLEIMTVSFSLDFNQAGAKADRLLHIGRPEGREWWLQSNYYRWPALTHCNWHVVQDHWAFADCRPAPHTSQNSQIRSRQ